MTDAPTSTKPTWRQSRWLLPLLTVSLAFNLLVLGGIAAAAWHRHHGHHWRGEHGLMGFVRSLPSERQSSVRETIASARGEIRAQRAAIRSAMAEANALLAAEPFDAEKFKSAMSKASAEEDKLRAKIADVLAATASALTSEERVKLKEWREQRRPRWFKHGKHRGGFGDDDDAGDTGPPPAAAQP